MNTGDLLLRAVLCDPGDDTARLAYADWLEEQSETLTATCPGCGGSLEADAFMHVGPIGKPTQIIPIGKQPCRTCEDEYGDPSGLVRVKNAAHGRAAFVRDQIAGVVRMVPLAMLVPLEPLTGVMPHQTTRHATAGGCVVTCDHMELVYRRGFVDEVRLPAAFTEDFARELFARHPVTRVVLTDREPQQWLPEIRGLPPGCANRWFWSVRGPDSSVPGYPHYVPRGVQWSAVWLRAKWYCDTPTYDTADAANAALSDACVAWGRSLAGLPPLPHASGGA